MQANSYYTAGKLAKIEPQNGGNSIAGQFKLAYQDNGDDASDVMKYAFNSLKDRRKATQVAKNHNFIMTKKDKNILLLQVNKNTGEVDGEIVLGRDRSPVYAIDEVLGQVYYLESGKSLIAYKVN